MIELTTAFNPGDSDPGKTYTHVRTVEVVLQARDQWIRVGMERLYLDGAEWVIGNTGMLNLTIDREDFHTLKKIKAKKGDGDIIREFFKACEQFAIDQGVVEGDIVEDPMLDDPPAAEETVTPPDPRPPNPSNGDGEIT